MRRSPLGRPLVLALVFATGCAGSFNPNRTPAIKGTWTLLAVSPALDASWESADQLNVSASLAVQWHGDSHPSTGHFSLVLHRPTGTVQTSGGWARQDVGGQPAYWLHPSDGGSGFGCDVSGEYLYLGPYQVPGYGLGYLWFTRTQ